MKMMQQKEKLFLVVMAFLPVMLHAQGKAFVINGKMSKKADAVQAIIMYDDGKKGTVDSTRVINGKFQFKGSMVDAAGAKLVVVHPNAGHSDSDVLDLYVEGGNITITAGDRVEKATISGSKINEEGKKYKTLIAPFEKEVNESINAFRAVSEEQRKDKAFMEGLQAGYDKAIAAQRKVQGEYIQQHPGDYLSLLILKDMAWVPFDATIEPLFNSLSDNVRNTERGLVLGKAIEDQKAYAIGATAPDFTQNDVNDQPVSLKDFRGKYVLLDFWASWCEPCRAENPFVVKAYNRFKDKNFTVLGVSLDRPGRKNSWLAAIKEDGLQGTQVSDLNFWDTKAVKMYGVIGVPQNFLIDPNGKIIAKTLRGEELEKKLEEILGR
jgi:peroxiredoxin